MTIRTLASALLCLWIAIYSLGVTKLGIIPIKLIITIAYIILGIIVFFVSKKIELHQINLLITIAFGVFMAFLVGLYNEFYVSTLSQFVSMCVSFLMVILTIELAMSRQINATQIKSAIYISAVIGILSKLALVFMIVGGLISAENVNNLYQGFFGGSEESIHANRGFMSILPRFGNAGDLFYVIVFVFMMKDFRGKKLFLMWLLTLAVVLISYSRYLMACFSFISMWLLLLSARKQPIKISLAFITISLIAFNFIDLNAVYLELVERYTGQIQSESDAIRSEMIGLLYGEFEKNMLFGIGLGGYTGAYIRSDVNLWMYETEYLALLMQLGIVGFLAIVIGYVIYITRQMFVLCPNRTRYFQISFSMIILLALPMQSALFVGTQFSVALISIFFLSRSSEWIKNIHDKNSEKRRASKTKGKDNNLLKSVNVQLGTSQI